MKANSSQLFCRAGLLTGSLLVLSGVSIRGADKASADAFPNYESYIKISGQAASIDGDKAAFKNRTAQPTDGVGIEELHVSKEVSKGTTLVIDGRALSGSEDYLGSFNLTKTEVGSINAGYKRFRTFYDGVGGFFPLSKQWNAMGTEELHTDRSKFWVEGKLNLPNMPVFTLRYANELRSGRKDSTIWASSDLTGLPLTLAPNVITQTRKGVPSYINLGERHENLELSATHKIKNTEMRFTLLGDRTKNLDTRYFTNFPGAVIPWSIASLSTTVPAGQLVSPQVAAKALLTAPNWNNQAFFAQSDGLRTKTSGATFDSDTIINDQLSLHLGGNFELLHSDISGDRPVITATPTASGILSVPTATFTGLVGGSRVKSYTGNIALNYKATKDLLMKFAVRGQDEYIRGASTYSVIASTVAATAVPPVTYATTPRLAYAKIDQKVMTPVLDLRYTGVKDLTLYFTGSKRTLDGTERNSSAFNYITAPAGGTLANNNVAERHGDYTLGANWKASALLTFRAEGYDKGHKDNSVGFATRIGDYYLLDSRNAGYKLTAIAKPDPLVSFTTRFVSQRTTMQVTGYGTNFPAYDSLNGKNYMLGETVDWTVSPTCYAQFNGNVVYNVIDTIYPRAGQTVATATANSWDVNKVVQNSNNNYITGSVLTGFVVDKETDAQVQLTYYRANNGNPVLLSTTMPYGVAAKDVTVTVGVKHKFSERWIGHAKVGYFDSHNDTTGGNTNFRGPLGYLSMEYGL